MVNFILVNYVYFLKCASKIKEIYNTRFHLRAENFSPNPKQKSPARALVPAGFTFCCSALRQKCEREFSDMVLQVAVANLFESTQYQEQQKWLYLDPKIPPQKTYYTEIIQITNSFYSGCLSQHYYVYSMLNNQNNLNQPTICRDPIDHRVSAKRSLASITYIMSYGQVRWVESWPSEMSTSESPCMNTLPYKAKVIGQMR